MLKIQKWLLLSLLITSVSCSNVCMANKVDAVVNVIKKSVGKVDDVASAAGKASVAHIDDVAKHPAPLVNKNTAVQNIGEDASFWQTYAGTQVIRRLGECVANKMKIYPSYSQAQALAVCKQSYSTCKSNKNSVSTDEQCIAEVSKPQSFVLKPKYDYLGPTLDTNSLKNQK